MSATASSSPPSATPSARSRPRSRSTPRAPGAPRSATSPVSPASRWSPTAAASRTAPERLQECGLDRREGGFDSLAVDVEVGDHADAAFEQASFDPGRLELVVQVRRVGDVEDDDVRFDCGRVDLDTVDLGQALGEEL